MTPKLFIGPMSKNVVDAAIEYAEENNQVLGFIPSRRQIDYNTGYVHNWSTESFTNYVKIRNLKIILERDHAGANQGEQADNGKESLSHDCQFLDIIHIDPFVQHKDLKKALNCTIEHINFCLQTNPNIRFEVGTEQSIFEYTTTNLFWFLERLKRALKESFESIEYVVIQSGTKLLMNKNIGNYDEQQLSIMIEITKNFNLKSKEHNGDYLSKNIIKRKFKKGLDAINIAPEFGYIETSYILEKIKKAKRKNLFELLYNTCFYSKRWKKWVPKEFDPEKQKEDLIKICGHYVFTSSYIKYIKRELKIDDKEIKEKIKKRIREINE